jgi:hypothetical protein
MASEPPSSGPQPAAEQKSIPDEQLTINLHVLSQSVGTNRPLVLSDLPATSTIRQLKERIRQSLPMRPADENQRLIHRGRVLQRDDDTMLDVFGMDAVSLEAVIYLGHL